MPLHGSTACGSQYSTLIRDVIGPLKYSTVALIYEDSLFPISEINGARAYLKRIEAQVVLDESIRPR
jgi:hypothetical protein